MENKNLHIIHQYLNNEIDIEVLRQKLSDKEFEEWHAVISMMEDMPKVDFDVNKEFELLQQKKQTKTSNKTTYYFLKIASVLILCIATSIFISLYFSNVASKTNISYTDTNEEFFELPDYSRVKLNAASSISFSEKNWNENRKIKLVGEAFFDVEKGNSFVVTTDAGEVEVLGTSFNVKSMDSEFSVTCYTGRVKVKFAEKEIILNPGESINNITDKLVSVQLPLPEWMMQQIRFEATPLSEVIKKIEANKNVQINFNDTKPVYFSGAFYYEMKTEEILALLSQSLNLEYAKINNNTYELNIP